MSYIPLFRKSAQRDLKGLSNDAQDRVLAIVDDLCLDPTPPASTALTGALAGLRKVRVGSYRVVYDVDEGQGLVRIWGIGHRSHIYELMRRRVEP
jgi:mRNA interferase RelE/StbE